MYGVRIGSFEHFFYVLTLSLRFNTSLPFKDIFFTGHSNYYPELLLYQTKLNKSTKLNYTQPNQPTLN